MQTDTKMVTLRLSPNDIHMAYYLYTNSFVARCKNCPDMLNYLVCKLSEDIESNKTKSDGRIIQNLIEQNRIMLKMNPFIDEEVNIADTKLKVGKPYNAYINYDSLNTLHNHIIKFTEIKKPHSSWIVQLAILYSFLPLAKKLGDFDIDKEGENISKRINEIEKLYMVEKLAKVLRNKDYDIKKVETIKEILDSM